MTRLSHPLRHIAGLLGLIALISSAQAEPVSYAIDPLHTAVRFGYDHLGWTWQQHRFDKLDGKLQYDREARSGSVDIQIDVRSINTGSALFNGQMQAEDLFDAARYPTIHFRSTALNFEGERLVSIVGELTIKGITRPVTLSVSRFRSGPHPVQTRRESLGAIASATVKRSDFNLLKQLPLVADEISLDLSLQAFKL